MDNLKELTYDPDETKKTWHFYNENGDATMVVSIDYKDGHSDMYLERMIKLHARGFRVKHIEEQ
jgi:hypothetical protein